MSIIITIIIFGIIVLIHEFGHFIVAVKCGVLVEEFAIGMGPKLFGIQRGDTLYSIRLFPLGGFCKMADEYVPNSKGKKGFNEISIPKKMAIMVAGVIMNFLLALIILSVLSMLNGFAEPTVKELMKGYPAESSGILPGDRIIKFNDSKIRIYQDLFFELSENKDKSVILTIDRNGEKFEKEIVPVKDTNGNYITGFKLDAKSPIFGENYEGFEKAGFFESISNGYWNMVFMVKTTIIGVVRLFTFNMSVDDVTGPIGLTTIIGSEYENSIKYSLATAIQTMANLVALLSANLGVMNLLPIPALDGGHLVFLFVELIRRKPIPPEKEGMVHFVGFVLLMVFAVFIAYNDIVKLI